jgi:hypothetical protein
MAAIIQKLIFKEPVSQSLYGPILNPEMYPWIPGSQVEILENVGNITDYVSRDSGIL